MADTYTEPRTRGTRPQTASAEHLLKRWSRLLAKRQQVDAYAQDIADLVAPGKNFITVRAQEGQKATSKVFDSTAMKANADLAANLAGAMTSSAHEWFSLKFGQAELNRMKTATEWLEDCQKRMYSALNSKSNFHQENLEAFLDLTTFAQDCLFLEEQEPEASGAFKGLRFKAIAFGTYCIDEDAEGNVNTLFYTFELSAQAAYDKWGGQAGQAVAKCIEDKKDPDRPFEFLHAIYPDPRAADPRWASCLVTMQDKAKVEEKTYGRFPAMVTRWAKRAGNIYGSDGPSHLAFPAIRSLNAAKEIVLKAAPLAMQPPTYERSDAVIGDPDLTPGGRTVVDATGAIGDSFGFLDTHSRPDVSQFIFEELRQEIRELYFVNQLRLKQSPSMTATEVLELRNQMERLLGPVAGRIEVDRLTPTVKGVWQIMLTANAFLPPPSELVAWLLEHGQDSADFDIQYEGPLQRVRRSDDALAIQATVNDAITMSTATGRAEILDSINFDKVLTVLGEIRGTPAEIWNDEQFIKSLRDGRAAQQKQQADLAAAQQAGSAIGGGQGVKSLVEASKLNTAGLGQAA